MHAEIQIFLSRYIPLALLEVVPQQLHWRAPAYVARNDLECLLASDAAADWVRLLLLPANAMPLHLPVLLRPSAPSCSPPTCMLSFACMVADTSSFCVTLQADVALSCLPLLTY